MDLPRPLSHSSISLYAECPQKYRFKYIDRIPEKPRHFFSFGSSVHLALEFFYGVKEPPAPTIQEVLAYYKQNWMSGGYKDPLQEAQYFEDGVAILKAFYAKHAPSFEIPMFVEYAFSMEVDGIPVTGKVDRVDRLPSGRLAVIDYKTGKQLVNARVAVDSQLTMYQLACEQLLGAEVERLIFYHLPSLKEHVSERHTKEQISGLRRRVVDTADSIMKERFDPKPDEQKCRWCDYKPICPVFKHQYPKAAAPQAAAGSDDELAALIDRYGEAVGQVADLKERISSLLIQKGYVRAFGTKYALARETSAAWRFDDKKKVLELLRKTGAYEKVLAPSAPLVQKLMNDPAVEPELRSRLEELGEKVESSELKISPLTPQ